MNEIDPTSPLSDSHWGEKKKKKEEERKERPGASKSSCQFRGYLPKEKGGGKRRDRNSLHVRFGQNFRLLPLSGGGWEWLQRSAGRQGSTQRKEKKKKRRSRGCCHADASPGRKKREKKRGRGEKKEIACRPRCVFWRVGFSQGKGRASRYRYQSSFPSAAGTERKKRKRKKKEGKGRPGSLKTPQRSGHIELFPLGKREEKGEEVLLDQAIPAEKEGEKRKEEEGAVFWCSLFSFGGKKKKMGREKSPSIKVLARLKKKEKEEGGKRGGEITTLIHCWRQRLTLSSKGRKKRGGKREGIGAYSFADAVLLDCPPLHPSEKKKREGKKKKRGGRGKEIWSSAGISPSSICLSPMCR